MKHSQMYLQQSSSPFTSRMWLDYCDETKGPFAKTKDYAGYVRSNFKWLVKEYNKRNGKKELNIK
jgi:hypothetical protein